MWDLKTIKEINDVEKMDKHMSKLWRYLSAWRKFCITRNQKK